MRTRNRIYEKVDGMDHTPKGKNRLSCRTGSLGVPAELNNPTTLDRNHMGIPTDNKQVPRFKLENEHSPVYFPCTQEVVDDLDVVWDWNSPQSTKTRIQNQKRVCTSPFPKIPIKRHPSNTHVQTFDKLKSDLEALRNQLVCETDQVDFNTSPSALAALCGQEIRQNNQNAVDLEMLFEDSVEEELLLCSQQVENTVGLQIKNNAYDISSLIDNTNVILNRLHSKAKSDNHLESKKQCAIDNQITTKYNFKFNSETNCSKKLNFDTNSNKISYLQTSVHKDFPDNKNDRRSVASSHTNFGDDSFDLALETFKDEDFDTMTRTCTTTELRKQKENSAFNHCDRTKRPTTSIVNEIERKKVQALAKLETKKKPAPLNEISSVKFSLEEIKRKRLEALSRLEAKKKLSGGSSNATQNEVHTSESLGSYWSSSNNIKQEVPTITYKTEEIERKRLEALAKLEAKKKQDNLSPIKSAPEKITEVQQNARSNETSPIKCSPEEIEQKRLQALAKLEVKKKQEIIEKNRQEALRRLEMNKKKRIMDSQRCLVSRAFSR